jgi:hypothetical protein
MDAPALVEIQPVGSALEALPQVDDGTTSSSNESSRRGKKRHHGSNAAREAQTVRFEGTAYYRSYDRYSQRGYRW